MTTRDKLEFALLMGRRTRATVRQCEALLRYSATLHTISQQLTGSISPGRLRLLDKRDRIRERVLDIVDAWNEGMDLPQYYVNIRNQPTVTALKIRVPDGGEVVVPS